MTDNAIALLSSSDTKEQLIGLRLLAEQKELWPTAYPKLYELMCSECVEVVGKAIWRIGEIGLVHPELITDTDYQTILGYLGSTESILRQRAVNALGRIGRGNPKRIAPELQKVLSLLSDPEPEVRIGVIWACENIATTAPELLAPDMVRFVPALSDENDRVRMEAPEIFRVMGKRKPTAILPYQQALEKLSQTDSNRVARIHATGALRALKTALKEE